MTRLTFGVAAAAMDNQAAAAHACPELRTRPGLWRVYATLTVLTLGWSRASDRVTMRQLLDTMQTNNETRLRGQLQQLHDLGLWSVTFPGRRAVGTTITVPDPFFAGAPAERATMQSQVYARHLLTTATHRSGLTSRSWRIIVGMAVHVAMSGQLHLTGTSGQLADRFGLYDRKVLAAELRSLRSEGVATDCTTAATDDTLLYWSSTSGRSATRTLTVAPTLAAAATHNLTDRQRTILQPEPDQPQLDIGDVEHAPPPSPAAHHRPTRPDSPPAAAQPTLLAVISAPDGQPQPCGDVPAAPLQAVVDNPAREVLRRVIAKAPVVERHLDASFGQGVEGNIAAGRFLARFGATVARQLTEGFTVAQLANHLLHHHDLTTLDNVARFLTSPAAFRDLHKPRTSHQQLHEPDDTQLHVGRP